MATWSTQHLQAVFLLSPLRSHYMMILIWTQNNLSFGTHFLFHHILPKLNEPFCFTFDFGTSWLPNMEWVEGWIFMFLSGLIQIRRIIFSSCVSDCHCRHKSLFLFFLYFGMALILMSFVLFSHAVGKQRNNNIGYIFLSPSEIHQ